MFDALGADPDDAESERVAAERLGQAVGRDHFEFAVRAADDLLARATAEGAGLMWVQAEHRAQPEFLVAQTGYMQGAAGIGMMLLHLDAVIAAQESPRIVFPDTPY